MGRPTQYVINVYVSQEQKDMISRICEEKGISRSHFLKIAMVKYLLGVEKNGKYA